MKNVLDILSPEELLGYKLCALYSTYGYGKYRMSKFEEYDLYVKNKEFLISDNVITFTDTDGKLLALKPDVTLSIIKNSKDNANEALKVYYNENVYRVSKGTHSFKEIRQAGLEYLGCVDNETLVEVAFLAKKSLDEICTSNVLEISQLDLVKEILACTSVSESGIEKIVTFLASKNTQGVAQVCEEEGVSEENAKLILKLVTTYGKAEKVADKLNEFRVNEKTSKAVDDLVFVTRALEEKGVTVSIDFSIVSDMNYYNGLAFKGFVEGVPVSVLSGGQYDALMKKMNKKAQAVGFAVYLDEIANVNA